MPCAACLFTSAGDPLAGPSAFDAVAAGCTYINPVYSSDKLPHFGSQHPYLSSALAGTPSVCDYKHGDADDAVRCIKAALARKDTSEPVIPHDFKESAYVQRVAKILTAKTV